MIAGIGLGQLVRYVREAQEPGRADLFVGVSGVMARELAAELAAGGRPGIVRVGGEEGAAVEVRVLGGEPTDDDVAALRHAVRSDVPAVVVQIGAWTKPNPYVPADRVVTVPPGRGFPVAEIARAIVGAAPDDAGELAALLPVLRRAARDAVIRRAAVRAALVAARKSDDPDLPRLSLMQARMLGELRRVYAPGGAAAKPEPSGATAVFELAVPLATGLTARFLSRRLDAPAPLRAALAGGVCVLLGAAAPQLAELGRRL